ncbi:hypothetical protein [Luteibacter sp. UNCMF366Tsu5.1]|uniref:hypothetical protein n=1 Tax=Luteibacter sp. UNCMF366Tsu5.1 TaxID=1502758 RepID=UPI000908E098|nr:hypothetical protein [Luteibacter sp. UNCMF366Tsu5.1]SFW18746.1 hypothetical protein SAMN02800691_0162 [Luteibacter sp. UNCMF366Tsu5.1]
MEQTQDPVNRLFAFVTEFAQAMLAKSGEFYPFGGSISASGEIAGASGATEDGSEHPSAQEVYRLLTAGLASTASGNDVAAVALVANVTIPAELEAVSDNGIRVHVEAPGFARMVYVPYEVLPGEEPSIRLHDPIAVEVDPEFFVSARS